MTAENRGQARSERGGELEEIAPAPERTLVLSAFPLAAEQTATVRAAVGCEQAIALSTLRAIGSREAIRRLRGRRWDRVVFAKTATDPAEMRALADLALTVASGREKGHFDLAAGEFHRAGRGHVAGVLGRFAWAGVAGAAAALVNGASALSLLPRRVSPRNVRPGRSLAYLRANFSLPQVGGSVGHTSGVVNSFERLGYDVTVFAAAVPSGVSEHCRVVEVEVPASVALPHELNLYRYSRRFERRVRRALVAEPPSFLYQRYSLNDLSGVHLARRLKVPLVLEYNGSEVWAQQNWGRGLSVAAVSRAIEQTCLGHAQVVVTVSEPLRRQVIERGVSPERVVFYPNCVDAVEFDPSRFDGRARTAARERLGIPPGVCLITFVGTFGRWHGAEVFAEAIRLLPDAVGKEVLHFLFIGDGLTAGAVREMLAADIGRRRVTMAGSRPQAETAATLAASDILVSPHVSNEDGTPFFGSPTKLFEYMAMAKPIVASDLDQIGRVLRGWTPADGMPAAGDPVAVLVAPGDADALARGIRRAVGMDAAAREELGRSARRQVLGAFTWDRHVASIVGKLEQAAGAR